MKETRIYLNTVEDITKSLSEGKTVYCEIDDAGYKARIKMINGILVQKQYDNDIYINAGDWIFRENAYYLKAKEPLKIEVGKFYKLAKGNKAFVYNKTSNNEYQAVEIGSDSYFEVSADGRHINNFLDYDIVDYWSEEND